MRKNNNQCLRERLGGRISWVLWRKDQYFSGLTWWLSWSVTWRYFCCSDAIPGRFLGFCMDAIGNSTEAFIFRNYLLCSWLWSKKPEVFSLDDEQHLHPSVCATPKYLFLWHVGWISVDSSTVIIKTEITGAPLSLVGYEAANTAATRIGVIYIYYKSAWHWPSPAYECLFSCVIKKPVVSATSKISL